MGRKPTAEQRARFLHLRRELRYFQMLNRLDARVLRKGIEKCKALGAELRQLRKEIRTNGRK